MSSVVTVMNMKGGVGKTTIAAHLAGMLAIYKYDGRERRVLALDYDPQFNLSQMFIPAATYFAREKQRLTSLAILQDDETRLDPFALQVPGNRTPPSVKALALGIRTRLSIIPSTLDLMYLAVGQPSQRTDAFEERFRKFIQNAKMEYDVIVIDCQPAGSILTKTALQNSDHVLIPVVASPFAARGVGLMRSFLQSNSAGATAPASHIVFNQVGTGPSPDENKIRADPRHSQYCLSEPIRRFKAFSDPVEGRGFVWSSGKPHSTRAFNNLQRFVVDFVNKSAI